MAINNERRNPDKTVGNFSLLLARSISTDRNSSDRLSPVPDLALDIAATFNPEYLGERVVNFVILGKEFQAP